MSKIRVLVLFGGQSGEHEVSLASARSVVSALDHEKYDIIPVLITKNGRWIASGTALDILSGGQEIAEGTSLPDFRAMGVDVVFPVLHGPYGEDGRLQGLLDMIGLPYVGSGVGGSAVGMDKIYSKAVFTQAGLKQLPFYAFNAYDWKTNQTAVIGGIEALGYPVFVKPANMGSSVGISKVKSSEALVAAIEEAIVYDTRIVVEKGLNRPREIELAVLGNDKPVVSIAGEIMPDIKHEFYSYESKYTDGGADLQIPANISPEMLAELQSLAKKAFQAVGARGLSRVDFLVDRETGDCYLNEINTMPGFTKFSMYPKLWEASGIGYSELLDRLIALAQEK
ncbi:MAG: D-alanine--D-alanine ligase family protein [Candidatus Gracilibacteria bacterium]